MINPLTLMKIINERHAFVKNHLDVFPFLKKNIGCNIKEGTIIKIEVKTPEGEVSALELTIQESDLPLFKKLAELLNQIN